MANLNRCGQRLFLTMVVCLAVSHSLQTTQPVSFAAEPNGPTRIPWTTSRVTGSPDPPPPFKVARAFPNIKLDRPILLSRCPGTDRLFIGEQDGTLYSFANRPDAQAELFFDLRKELKTVHLLPKASGVENVYALAFHPDFARNRQCFVCYALKSKESGQRNLENGTRISRFTVTESDPPRIDPLSEEIVLSFLQGGHNGSDMHFGPDGMLYISTGDAANPNPPDDFNTGQDISDLLSSILRIDVDHRDDGRNYSIPADNPFIATAGARHEVWAYGFRNPWRMSFDRQSGELYVGDVGWELWETIHRVESGGNYGWSAMEGPQPIKLEQLGPTPVHPALIELPHTIACSITGGYVYRGAKFPELYGAYVFGDWETRRLWAARFDAGKTQEMVEIVRPSVRVVAFGEDADGELYFIDHDAGTLHTLERNDSGSQNASFPTTLSETGLFESVATHQPAEGVVRFTVNSRQWQDGAAAEHWAAFPNSSSAILYTNGKPIPGLVNWHYFRMHFPKDAVLTRTMSLAGKRQETQMLHYDGMDWRGYTYAWRDDESDADLVPADGREKIVQNGERTHVWQFPSRSQCMSCHSNQSEYALAFSAEQLNRTNPNGQNQLVALTEAGVIRRMDDEGQALSPFDAVSVASERSIPDPSDESLTLESRARGYLHANCGHCHAEHGGGTVPLRLQYHVPLSEMQAIGSRPTRGDLGLLDAQIIKPGDPYGSTLFFRMAKFGKDRMPHIGAEWPDPAGLDLIERWIGSLKENAAVETLRISENVAAEQLANPEAALQVARRLGMDQLDSAERDDVLAAAAKLPDGLVRDLFEGYFPWDETAERKLGSSPRPQTILALEGNADRGEALFWSQGLNCGKCHRIGNRGVAVGPDLSKISKLRARDDLLDSLLAPSRRVEAKYATYVAQTVDGVVMTGLLVSRDESSLVIRDGEGRETKVKTSQVEEIRPSPTSLMPEGQMAGLTAQQAADLIEYLATRQ